MFNFIELFAFSDKLTCLPINLGRRTSYINWCIFYLVIKVEILEMQKYAVHLSFVSRKYSVENQKLTFIHHKTIALGLQLEKLKKEWYLLQQLVVQMLTVLLSFLSIMVMNLNVFIKMTIILPSLSPMNVLQINQRLTNKILTWD